MFNEEMVYEVMGWVQMIILSFHMNNNYTVSRYFLEQKCNVYTFISVQGSHIIFPPAPTINHSIKYDV